MKFNPKSIGLFSLLVISIYVMRDGGISFTSPITRSAFRTLYDYARPSSATCDGVSLASTFSAAELKRAEQIQKSVQSIRKGNPLETMLSSGSFDGDQLKTYAMGLIAPVAVWAFMFLLSFVLCCCGICNWCCMFGCCKNGQCCRCCKIPTAEQTSQRKKTIYKLVTIVFMLGLFSAGIAGAVVSSSVSKGMKVSYCSMLGMVEDLVYGQKSSSWLGLKGIVASLTDILNNFGTTVNNLSSTTSSDFTNMNSTYATVSATVTSFYTTHQGQTVTRADPAQTTTTYEPTYISSLGPKTTSGTFMYTIQAELDGKHAALNSAQVQIDAAITQLQSGTVESSLQSGIDSASSISDSMDDMVSKLNGSGETVNNIITIIGKVILAIFIVYIVVGLLPIISILIIHFLKIEFFSKVMHFSWCLMGFLAIIGFLISIIFYPVSLVFTEFCEVLTVAVNDGAYFNETLGQALGGGQAGDLTYICMFGNGLALEQLGVADSVSNFDTIYDQLDAVNAVAPLSSSDPVPSTTIPYNTWLLGATASGYILDSTETTTDLSTLDALTNKNSNTCTSIQDTWLVSDVNCTSSQGTKYDSSSATFDEPSATCIGIDTWSASAYSGSITTRYTSSQFPNTCTQKNGGSQLSYVQSFVNNFVTNRGDVDTLMTTLKTDMSNSVTAGHLTYDEAQFGHYAYLCLQPFKTVKSDLQAIQDSLTGTTNGIIPNSNCKFVGTDLRLLTAALCTGFITSLYQATVVLIIVSIFSFFGAICVMCTAKRINVKQENKANNPSVAPVPEGFKYM